jgi:predicted GTPase
MDTSDWKQKALLPKLLTEEDASYNAVLDLHQALANDDICNIALTGPFGSGKSSVIHTLIDLEQKKRIISYIFCLSP